jgi:N-acetylneuraminic acid mutarotase
MTFRKVSIVTSFFLFMLLVVFSYECNADGIWKDKKNAPTATAWFPTCEFNGKIYLFDSNGGTREYNPDEDTWTEKARLVTTRGDHAAVVVNDKIYATVDRGGMYEYDPIKDTWTEKAKPKFPKRATPLATVNGKIYAISGVTVEDTVAFPKVEEYDPVKDIWTFKKDLPFSLAWSTTCTVDNKIYIIGGWDGAIVTTAVFEYDANADKLIRKTDIHIGLAFLPKSAPVINGRIYVIGGYKNEPVSDMQIYDIKSDTWEKGPSMPTARYALSTTAINGKIYAFCGATGGDFAKNQMWISKVEEYDTGEVVSNQAVDAKGKVTTSWGTIKAKLVLW